MRWSAFFRAALFPHKGVIITLVPAVALLLIYVLLHFPAQSPLSIAVYVLATYTLTICCARVPTFVRFCRNFKQNNKWARRWATDTAWRMRLTLHGSLALNIAYAALQLGLGIRHRSFWFFGVAGYYALLALMRLFLVNHTRRYRAGTQICEEYVKYRACGVVLLLLNLALTAMMLMMIYQNRTFHHHRITAIAIAAYTFAALALAIVNIVRYRRHNRPVYAAAKAISLAAACVSMLTLTQTLLTTFGGESTSDTFRRVILATSGGVVSAGIILMAVAMIVRGTGQIKRITKENTNG